MTRVADLTRARDNSVPEVRRLRLGGAMTPRSHAEMRANIGMHVHAVLSILTRRVASVQARTGPNKDSGHGASSNKP